jgi:hypothetical protein
MVYKRQTPPISIQHKANKQTAHNRFKETPQKLTPLPPTKATSQKIKIK